MLLKILLLARDRPILFFFIAIPTVAFFLCFQVLLFILIDHFILQPYGLGANARAMTISLLIIPVTPPLFLVFILFAEFYFKLLRLGWLVGFGKKSLANKLIEMIDKDSGEVDSQGVFRKKNDFEK